MMQHSICRASLRFCLALFLLVMAVNVSAQVVTTGAITGTVTDATGANVPVDQVAHGLRVSIEKQQKVDRPFGEFRQ